MRPTDFAYRLTGYLGSYLPGQQGMSTNTIKSYRDTFSLFLKYCEEKESLPPEKLSLNHFNRLLVERFLTWLEEERGCSISTRNQRLAAIHAFFRYLQMEAPENLLLHQQILSVKFKRAPKASIQYISIEGMKAILAQPDTATSNGVRDLTLLCLLYDTGARVQEIADLVVGDVRLDAPSTVKLTGKGQKARIVPLMSQTASLLGKYMDDRYLRSPEKKAFPLFCNRMRQKLTRAGIAYILDKYVQSVKAHSSALLPEKVSPHSLRHSKAMHLLQSGVNLIYIRDLLGHVDLKTTEVYARADAEMKRTALESAYKSITPDSTSTWHEDAGLMKWLHELCKPS